MKSHYNHTVTESQAIRIGHEYAKREIERFNREELPKIRNSYAKMFILTLHYSLGLGDIRMRRVLKALGEMTCEVHNFTIDGVFHDIYDKRLKECGLWDAYQEFANGECVPMSEDSPYVKPKKDNENDS